MTVEAPATSTTAARRSWDLHGRPVGRHDVACAEDELDLTGRRGDEPHLHCGGCAVRGERGDRDAAVDLARLDVGAAVVTVDAGVLERRPVVCEHPFEASDLFVAEAQLDGEGCTGLD